MTIAWDDDALVTRMAAGWPDAIGRGTHCGIGSTFDHTRNAILWIPQMMAKYRLQSLCDAGSGDLAWRRGMVGEFTYRAFDLVKWREDVTEIDITKEALPACDVILCRAVLIHLDPPRIARALELFSQSAKFLMATSEPSSNTFDPDQQCNPVDLTAAPYNLGPPLESVEDLEGPRSILGLWSLA